MPVTSRNSRLSVAATLLVMLTACAPNTAVTPLAPDLAGGGKDAYATLLRMADSTRAAGDPVAAIHLYQQAIALDRGRTEAYNHLGDTMIELGEYHEAADRFRYVLDDNANDAAAHRGYARAMLGLERPEAALVHYQAALEQDAGDVQAYNGLGVAFDLAGQHAAAEDAYRRGLQVAPDSILLRNNLGLSLSLAGRHDEALTLLRRVVDEPGATARNRQNLALAYALSGDLVAAERISRLDLDEDAVQNNLAYFSTLAALDDRRKRAAALGVHAPETNERAADHGAPQRLAAMAIEGDGLELGLAPTGRWFVNLGDHPDAGHASAAWRRLRDQHGDLLGNLSRLAGIQDGGQPLLVGPLGNADEAQRLCDDLHRRGQTCRPLAL
jgi:Flp pilus assembly protein TadD